MEKVLVDEVVSAPAGADALPERVEVALGELAGAAKEGLLALSVGVGLGVMAELMEEELDEVVGPKATATAIPIRTRSTATRRCSSRWTPSTQRVTTATR